MKGSFNEAQLSFKWHNQSHKSSSNKMRISLRQMPQRKDTASSFYCTAEQTRTDPIWNMALDGIVSDIARACLGYLPGGSCSPNDNVRKCMCIYEELLKLFNIPYSICICLDCTPLSYLIWALTLSELGFFYFISVRVRLARLPEHSGRNWT